MLEGWLGWPGGDSEWATSEETVRRVAWLRAGLHFAGFQLVLMWAVLSRTRLALLGGRSALLAGAATAWLVLRHPLRTLGPLALLLAVELALLVGLGLAAAAVQRGFAPDSGLARVAVLGALGLAALALREVLQGARYAAACEASRGLVGALQPRDPWAERVGGPGGPQYTIGDQDEFSVSL